MNSSSIFLALLLATTPTHCATTNTEGVPTTPELCEEIAVELNDAVDNAGLDPAVASQVISNCMANT